MEIIPAIDLIDGRCVRLTQGDYNDKKVYEQDPLDMAKSYADCGVRRLHVVDLDGAKAKAPCNLAVLEKLASHTNLDIVSCNAAVKFNACCIESHACTAADTAADQCICIEAA